MIDWCHGPVGDRAGYRYIHFHRHPNRLPAEGPAACLRLGLTMAMVFQSSCCWGSLAGATDGTFIRW